MKHHQSMATLDHCTGTGPACVAFQRPRMQLLQKPVGLRSYDRRRPVRDRRDDHDLSIVYYHNASGSEPEGLDPDRPWEHLTAQLNDTLRWLDP